jgi:hypothetical protein
MPKDATKNIDRYKIRGGQLNEFEYAQSQQALAEKKPKGGANLIPGTPPEEAGDSQQPTVKAKASNATKGTKSTKARKATKGTKKAKVNSTKGATAKKLAARKAAKKSRPATKK